MKLSEVQSGNRLFTGTNREGVTFTFLVRYMGKDGHTSDPSDLWLGRMKAGNSPSMPAAIAVADDGTLIAVNVADPDGAIKHSLGVRKGYGPSLRPDLNWRVREYTDTRLEGYSR